MRYEATLRVQKETAELMEKWCQEPPMDCGRGEPVFDEEVRFANGNRMAIQVIASENPNEESCWTQGVVFDKKGNELGCTDVGESFLGEYQVWDRYKPGVYEVEDEVEDEYVTHVVVDHVQIRSNAIRAVMQKGDRFIFPKESSKNRAISNTYEGLEGEYIRSHEGWVYVRIFTLDGKKLARNLSVVRFYEMLVTLGKVQREV